MWRENLIRITEEGESEKQRSHSGYQTRWKHTSGNRWGDQRWGHGGRGDGRKWPRCHLEQNKAQSKGDTASCEIPHRVVHSYNREGFIRPARRDRGRETGKEGRKEVAFKVPGMVKIMRKGKEVSYSVPCTHKGSQIWAFNVLSKWDLASSDRNTKTGWNPILHQRNLIFSTLTGSYHLNTS